MLAGLQNVTFEFGARAIVRDATWHIQPGERIGLIGYNGTGKSTLLKLFVGDYVPSAGTVERSKGTTIGYLHQDLLSFDTDSSILEVALGAFEYILNLEKEIEELGKQIEADPLESLVHLFSDKLHELDTLGGYNIHHRTEEVLQGLGFLPEDLSRPYRQFSGGWRMRVLLAKMILQQPDLLLLDEPTNHLDLPSIEWLEKYLMHYKGSVVIVSHDKYFLNRMVTKIVELYQQQLHIYNGNYDYYEQEKQVRQEMQQRAYENQQDFIRQQERFIERFKAKASKAAAAQSAMKRLEKLDRVEVASVDRPSIRINFQLDKIPGKIICSLKKIHKQFGDNVILDGAHAEIDRGDKIALIGANGKGKSTLLRIIADAEKFEGERIWGHNVQESFYAQHQLEALRVNDTILEEMLHSGSQRTELELRTLLGCFLFSGDDVEKKIRVLSGGEKARVALAKVIISKANFLMLDEPTNHLDLLSIDLLIEALRRYEGSYILVSHDRHFISQTANTIWEIDDHQIRVFKGTYAEWVDWKERREKEEELGNRKQEAGSREQELGSKKQESGNRNQGTGNKGNEERQNIEQSKKVDPEPVKSAINKDVKKELQRIQKRFQQIEERMAVLFKEKEQLEGKLSDPEIYSDKNKFHQAEEAYTKRSMEYASLQSEYEEVFETMMTLESRLTS